MFIHFIVEYKPYFLSFFCTWVYYPYFLIFLTLCFVQQIITQQKYKIIIICKAATVMSLKKKK